MRFHPCQHRRARRRDFEYMRSAPGAFPELGEIHRQLLDASVPTQILEMECREIFGALLEQWQYQRLESEHSSPLPEDPEGHQQESLRLLCEFYRGEAERAGQETVARLTSMGIEPDSETAHRILQLRPTTPLVPLATTPTPPPVMTPQRHTPTAEMMAEAALEQMRAAVDATSRGSAAVP